jgi:serine/threonine protein kinase
VEEAQITSQLEHPDIVPVHELGFDCSNNIFYTMKLMRGLTLTEILLGLRHGDQKIIERFPLSRLLTIFQKSCDAMAFAHSRGVVHRDIKPDNIMVGDYGEVVLMDWGLARIVPHPEVEGAQSDAQSGNRGRTIGMGIDQFVESIRNDEVGTSLKTMTGRIMGTPGFMAPEQIRLQDEAPDIRSDIYSLGATLYSILTLCPPITGKDVREILRVSDEDNLELISGHFRVGREIAVAAALSPGADSTDAAGDRHQGSFG